MAYLLKINQNERSYDIGVFESEQSVCKFIEKIPFVKKENCNFNYINYYMDFKDIPEYYEVNYNNYLYIITKFSFIPDENDIFFSWNKINCWYENMAIKETFTDGETIVDAYSIPNNKAKDYIQNRETLYRETVRYYEEK